MADTLFRSHSLEKTSSNGEVITSGSLTTWEDNPVSPLNVGDTFQPVPNGPRLKVKRVSINDNVIGLNAGQPVRQWQISVEGDNEADVSDTTAEDKHSFAIEQDNDSVLHSGSLSVMAQGENPPSNISVGDTINIPGVGRLVCRRISGSDDFNDNGVRVWNITYECSDAPNDPLPNTKYSFSIENEHSGSMQVVNDGSSPSISLSVGSTFSIPGIGNVTCTKISGSDEFTDTGVHRWTVTYEGSDATQDSSDNDNVRYSFSLDIDGSSGSMQEVQYGNAPSFQYSIGNSIRIPGVGSLYCSKVDGSDEYTDDGRHKWNVTYEASSVAPSSSQETLPDTKYNLAIEKDNDGVLQTSGSMAVVNQGDSPALNIAVGDSFRVPGVGLLTCSKVSGSDSYSDSGLHLWTMTYEGYVSGGSSGGGDDQPVTSDSDTKYSFVFDASSKSGSVEISSISDAPSTRYSIGDTINIPGIGNVTCTKISGSDSYTENGNRKWTVVFEAASNQDEQEQTTDSSVKYTFSRELNSDGVVVYSGSKQFTIERNGTIGYSVGGEVQIPFCGSLTCTKISGNDGEYGNWVVTVEASGSSGSGEQGGEETGDTSLPETETSISYEINGLTVRTVSGELIALKRSETPISRKNITLYSDNESSGFSPGDTYQGGIISSISSSRETIKNNNVVTRSYYKHVIEVEA